MTNTTTSITTENQSTTEQLTNKAGDVAGTARDEAAGVMQDTKQQARRLAGESRDQLRQQADQQGQRLAQTLRDIGGQLQGMARGDSAPSGMLADVTQQAASSAQRMAQTLDQKGVQGVVADVKRFARQRPGVFILGAVGAGLITGRLIRALDTSAVAEAAKPSNGADNPTGSDNGLDIGPAALNRPREF